MRDIMTSTETRGIIEGTVTFNCNNGLLSISCLYEDSDTPTFLDIDGRQEYTVPIACGKQTAECNAYVMASLTEKRVHCTSHGHDGLWVYKVE